MYTPVRIETPPVETTCVSRNGELSVSSIVAEPSASGLTVRIKFFGGKGKALLRTGCTLPIAVMDKLCTAWLAMRQKADLSVLTTYCEKHGLEEADLDDLVHDYASDNGSNVNNSGLEEQLTYILQGSNPGLVLIELEKIKRAKIDKGK